MPGLLTTREVAELASVPVRAVDKAVEEKVLTGVRRTARSGRTRRALPLHAVPYAAITGRLTLKLSLAEKRRLARTLAQRPAAQMTAEPIEIAEGVSVDARKLIGSDPVARAARYVSNREAHIEENPEILGGTPVLRGTRISVHAIRGRLEDGDSVEMVLADYPELTREAIETAALYARTHPLVGRPGGRPWKRAA